MSETPTPVAPGMPEGGDKPAGFLQNLADLYFAPKDAFGRIARAPGWLLPAIGYLVVVIAFTAVWSSKMEPRQFVQAQIEQSGQADRIPADRREEVIEQQTKLMPIFLWGGSILGTVVTLAVVAGFFLFVFRFFYGGELKFGQSLAITSWTFFAVSLVTTPLMLLVFALKGDWNINPQEVLRANLTLFLDPTTAAKPLWSLLASIDLFTIWMVFLLATGYAVAVRKGVGSTVWGVAVPWAIIVAVKVAWAAIF